MQKNLFKKKSKNTFTKKSKNNKIVKKFPKIQKFKYLTKVLFFPINFFEEKKKKKCRGKKCYILVLPIEEISLWLELSSPPRFRIQGGYPEHGGGRRRLDMDILVSNMGFCSSLNGKTSVT